MSDAQPIRRKGIQLGAARRMSAEEMSAVESRIIEENFPTQRTLHLMPNDDAPQLSDYSEIVVTEEVLLATAHHVAQDLTKESGGFLLGNRYECPNTHRNYIIVDQFMKADYTEGTQVSLTFTTDSWAQLTNRLDGKYRGKQLVGWYHSHPGMGIFLSNYDVDIHKNRFSNPWEVALVLDPVKHEGGFFAWVDGNINPREKLDFYELLEGDSRDTVVAWTNYTAEDPKTGAPAGLKAVNTQTSDGVSATAAVTNVINPQSAASGGLFGNPYLLIGGAAVLALMLLGSIIGAIYLFSGKKDTSDNSSETDTTEVVNKVLNSEKVRVGKDLSASVTSGNKLIVDLQISGIGDETIINEVRNGDNLQVEFNSQPAVVTNSSVSNGVLLKARAERNLTANEIEAFNTGKSQPFIMAVDIFYNGDVVSRKFETNFQKGKGTNSMGTEVAFGEGGKEEIVKPRKTTPKAEVKTEVKEQPSAPKPPEKENGKTTKKPDPPKTDKNPPPSPTPIRTVGTGIRDGTKEPKVRNEKNGETNKRLGGKVQ